MAFVRPTLSEIADRVKQDIASRLSLAQPVLRRSLATIFGRVVAGVAHMLHGHLEYLSRQIFPDLSEEAFLLRQGAIFGMSKTAASFASGNLTFTGTNSTVILAGTRVQRADGAIFMTDAQGTISTGTATVAATAETAGADSNTDAAVTMQLESPIAGIDSTVTVANGGLSGGSDEETTEAFRDRVIERIQNPPAGGAAHDYVAWAKEIAGVTRAWCYPLEGGAGTVTVRFVRDNDASLIPDAGEVTAVQNHIDTKKPVTATVTVAAPTASAVAFTIHVVPDTTATRAAVQAELEDMLLRDASPGATILLSHIREAISDAEGVTDWTLTTPAADVTKTTGQLATMGTITWN